MSDDDRHDAMYLALDGVPGDLNAKGRGGWIDVTGVDWGVEQAVAISGAGGAMTGVGGKQRALRFITPHRRVVAAAARGVHGRKTVARGTFEVQRGKSGAVGWVFKTRL